VKAIPDVIDENGDINLHGRQGAVITLSFSLDDGSPEDVSAKAMVFECGTDINISLVNGSSVDEKVLTLTNADIKTIFAARNKDFVLLDNSGAQPTPRWMGTVYIRGWVE
jgi:hypothetical protein